MGVQVQSTPALAVSLLTVAFSVVLPPMITVVGAGVVKAIVTVEEAAEMETMPTAVVAWLVVEAAVIVTLPPVGAEAGAVKVVAAPLAVCAGLKVPQVPAGAQLQSTPALAVSFETVAAIVAVAFAARVVGGAWLKAMVTPPEDGGEYELDPEPHPEIPAARIERISTTHDSSRYDRCTFSTTASNEI